MRRFTLLVSLSVAVVLALCSLPVQPLEASTSSLALVLAVQETGGAIGSGLLTGLAPIATVLLTSFLTWGANTGLGIMADWSNLLKYAAMGVLGVVVSVLLGALGHTVSTDPSTWTAATGQGMAAAVVAALIYKLGQKA